MVVAWPFLFVAITAAEIWAWWRRTAAICLPARRRTGRPSLDTSVVPLGVVAVLCGDPDRPRPSGPGRPAGRPARGGGPAGGRANETRPRAPECWRRRRQRCSRSIRTGLCGSGSSRRTAPSAQPADLGRPWRGFGFGWLLNRRVDPGMWRAAGGYSTFCSLFVSPRRPGSSPPQPCSARRRASGIGSGPWSIPASWTSTFALIGLALGSSCPASARRGAAIADASYWIYLVHLPIVMVLVAVSAGPGLGLAGQSSLVLLGAAFALMLASYQLIGPVHSFIGATLNGLACGGARRGGAWADSEFASSTPMTSLFGRRDDRCPAHAPVRAGRLSPSCGRVGGGGMARRPSAKLYLAGGLLAMAFSCCCSALDSGPGGSRTPAVSDQPSPLGLHGGVHRHHGLGHLG